MDILKSVGRWELQTVDYKVPAPISVLLKQAQNMIYVFCQVDF